jgi:hypothetical protein
MGVLAFLSSRVNKSQGIFILTVIFFVLTLFAGLRGTVGSDTLNYLMIYQNSPPVNEFFEYAWSVEPGYLLFNSIHRSVFDSGFLYLLMYSALQAILLIILFKKIEIRHYFLSFI